MLELVLIKNLMHRSNNKAMSTDEMFANAMDTVNPFDDRMMF
jgi:hypothetical protein